jgi:hypothetical protein
VTLTAADAPPLFEALERIRQKIKGPTIHKVLLDSSFNASITQIPRFGLIGGGTNYLTVGLPLLMAVDRPRCLAIMAHEYGHLRGNHGQFAAWIYRTRLSWMKLSTPCILRFPLVLSAVSGQDFAGRQIEADRIAGKLVGREIAGAALTEIAIKSEWLDTAFWPLHWSAAAHNPQPVGPFAAMRTLLAQPMTDDFARQSFREALIQLSNEDDTHPVLRDRLEALNVPKQLPGWSTRPALELLGSDCTKWITHFDNQWCRDNASDWKMHHAYLSRVQVGIDTLTASIRRNNADEMTQLGDLQRRLDPNANVLATYERALKLTPGHAGALRGRWRPTRARASRPAALPGPLFEKSVANRWWASRTAVQMLEKQATNGDDKTLKQWRERLREANEGEHRAWAELTETPFFDSITRHDLNDFEKGEFQSDMARCKPVTRAWLVRKTLKEFACRRCYLLFVELPGMDDEDRYTLCRGLERTLDLPGQVLVLWAGHSPTLEDIQRKAFDAVYVRPVA